MKISVEYLSYLSIPAMFMPGENFVDWKVILLIASNEYNYVTIAYKYDYFRIFLCIANNLLLPTAN